MNKDWKKFFPLVGRSETKTRLTESLKNDKYFDFRFLCEKRKNVIDKEWLKNLLKDSHPKYKRVYFMFFLKTPTTPKHL
jgi:hypothetical protein